jgi:hypothetical protein
MSSAIEKPASASNRSKAISEIYELFERYGPTFVDLAVGKRSDMNALLEFYDAPLRFIGSSFHMVMKEKEDITGEEGIGGEIGRLRHAHFAGSTLDKARRGFSTLGARSWTLCGCGRMPPARSRNSQ